jgi:hypothetical protein
LAKIGNAPVAVLLARLSTNWQASARKQAHRIVTLHSGDSHNITLVVSTAVEARTVP